MAIKEVVDELKKLQVTEKQAEALTELIETLGRHQDQLHKAEDLLAECLKKPIPPYKKIIQYFEEVKLLFNVDTDTI